MSRGLITNKLLGKGRTVQALTLSDLGVWSGSSLINVVAPLFVIEQIKGGTITDVGIAALIYTAVGALVNIPLGKFMDNRKGYVDELIILAASNFIRGAAIIYMAFSHQLWQLYLVQVITGLAKSLNLNSWRILFTKFIDTKNMGVQWGLYETITSIGLGVAGFLGGFLGDRIGLSWVVLIGGIMSLISTIFPLLAYSDVKKAKTE